MRSLSSSDSSSPSTRSGLWLIVFVAFSVRVLLGFLSHWFDSVHPVRTFVGQEADYIAYSLSIGKGFSNPFPGYDRPTAWLAPVFPVLWSVGFKLFDPFKSQGHIYFCQALNCACAALTCIPIYRLANRCCNARVAAIAAWAWAFLPLAILFPLEWAWDQSVSALLMAWLLAWTNSLRDSPARSWEWPAYGVLWGVAALTNPSLCVMLPFFVGWMWFERAKRCARSLLPFVTALALFLIALVPWTVRNQRIFGHVFFVKSNFGLELWLGNNDQVKDVFTGWLHPIADRNELRQLNDLGEYAYMKKKQQESTAFIRSNPKAFAQHTALRVIDTWVGPYYFRDDPWTRSLGLNAPFTVFTGLFSLAAIAGMILACRK